MCRVAAVGVRAAIQAVQAAAGVGVAVGVAVGLVGVVRVGGMVTKSLRR